MIVSEIRKMILWFMDWLHHRSVHSLLVGATILLLLGFGLREIKSERTVVIQPNAITAVQGFSNTVMLPRHSFPWFVNGDSDEARYVSTLIVTEDGRQIGRPHTRHTDIANKGRGRYSHWHTALYFSSSDNSSPHTNGRRYEVTYHVIVNPWLVGFPLTAGFVLCLIWLGVQISKVILLDLEIERTFSAALLMQLGVITLLIPIGILLLQLPAPSPPYFPEFFLDYIYDVTKERNEKAIFIFIAIIGPIAATLGLASSWVRNPTAQWLVTSFILFVVVFHWTQQQLANEGGPLAAVGFVLLVFLVALTALKAPQNSHAGGSVVIPPRKPMNAQVAGIADISAVVLFLLLVAPLSVRDAAAMVDWEIHTVSFIIGPAISMSFGLVPGVDFHAHYGIGHAYIFSWFMGNNAIETIENFTPYYLIIIALFYSSAYVIVSRAIGTRLWAFLAVLVAFFLNFQTAKALGYPSNWPLRYPLMFVVTLLFSIVVTRRDYRFSALLGFVLGLSIFLNTETGLYFSLAVGVGLLVWDRRPDLLVFGIVVGASIVTLMTISVLAFGPGIFSWDFVYGLIEPLLIYGGGYGSYPINWAPGYGYIYAVSGELICGATIAALIYRSRAKLHSTDEAQSLAFVTITGMIALLMLLKFYNRSLDALWHLNAIPLLVILAWWLNRIQLRISARAGARAGWLVPVTAGLLSLAFLIFVQDHLRKSNDYALRSYWKHPGLLHALWAPSDRRELSDDDLIPIPDKSDIDLITSLTTPAERVAVLHRYDWTYLIEAKRAPKFYFLPSWIQLTHRFMDKSMANLDLIFVANNFMDTDLFYRKRKSFASVIMPYIRANFERVGRSKNLTVLRKKELRP